MKSKRARLKKGGLVRLAVVLLSALGGGCVLTVDESGRPVVEPDHETIEVLADKAADRINEELREGGN